MVVLPLSASLWTFAVSGVLGLSVSLTPSSHLSLPSLSPVSLEALVFVRLK
jgi:hypothetical protein